MGRAANFREMAGGFAGHVYPGHESNDLAPHVDAIVIRVPLVRSVYAIASIDNLGAHLRGYIDRVPAALRHRR
jgi:hypothetical protein